MPKTNCSNRLKENCDYLNQGRKLTTLLTPIIRIPFSRRSCTIFHNLKTLVNNLFTLLVYLFMNVYEWLDKKYLPPETFEFRKIQKIH